MLIFGCRKVEEEELRKKQEIERKQKEEEDKKEEERKKEEVLQTKIKSNIIKIYLLLIGTLKI